jgi:RecA/RadA recombinase
MAALPNVAAARALSPQLVALRAELASVVARPHVGDPTLSTGIAVLDAALTGGGLPRGRLTEVVAAPGSGATGLAWQWVAHALHSGTWAAVIDARGTLAPKDWVPFASHEGAWIVHPPTPARSAWCADIVLRSGAFGLVILDSPPALARETIVRLTRLAADADAALVQIQRHEQGRSPGSALRLSVQRLSPTELAVEIQKGGAPQRVRLPSAPPAAFALPPASAHDAPRARAAGSTRASRGG